MWEGEQKNFVPAREGEQKQFLVPLPAREGEPEKLASLAAVE
jgi:hypothetical protein